MDLNCRILINGQTLPGLPGDDRGCLYGDGVFRTLRAVAERPCWWPDQLAKLRADAQALGIPSPDDALWEADFKQLLSGARRSVVLKLVLTRGSGPRGYRPPDTVQANRLVACSDYPEQMDALAASGINLRICDLRLAEQPRLAGIKHLNRLENILARAEWNDPDIHEGLLLDSNGRVISGVSSNLFILQGDELLTPRLDRCGVAGVARARVMALADGLKLRARETDIRLDDVFSAREVMLTNSLMRVWPVARLMEQRWSDWPISLQLRAMLDA